MPDGKTRLPSFAINNDADCHVPPAVSSRTPPPTANAPPDAMFNGTKKVVVTGGKSGAVGADVGAEVCAAVENEMITIPLPP